jgi:HAMP domain-containing protein
LIPFEVVVFVVVFILLLLLCLYMTNLWQQRSLRKLLR